MEQNNIYDYEYYMLAGLYRFFSFPVLIGSSILNKSLISIYLYYGSKDACTQLYEWKTLIINPMTSLIVIKINDFPTRRIDRIRTLPHVIW